MNCSVVIPTYNGRALLEKHLPSVFASLHKQDEVVVVDDASTDDTIAWLKKTYPQVTIVEHKENMRYAASCNDGVHAAHHDLILLLNNDVSPQKDVLKFLYPHFEDEHVFAVGCKELDDNKRESGRSGGAIRRGMLIHWRSEDQNGQTTLWASGGSMIVRKDLWEKLGGMDLLFRPAYQEDRDICYRAWKSGYHVKFEPQSIVHHMHETTNAVTLGVRNLQIASYRNLFVFYWKNITDTSFILSHILWLPYHLIVGGVRSHGLIVVGFLRALRDIRSILLSRRAVSHFWKYTDSDVLRKAQES